MALDPVPVNFVCSDNLIQLLPKVLVQNSAASAGTPPSLSPSMSLPIIQPFGYSLLDIPRICIDRDLARLSQGSQALKDCLEFHAVIRSAILATEHFTAVTLKT